MSAPETVRWYCHSCHVTHTHTIAQRDAHRDALQAAEAARIDAQRKG